MPDDFDYSKPVVRNAALKASTPFITMAFIVLCITFTAVYWIAPSDNPASPFTKLVNVLLLQPRQIWAGNYVGLFSSFFIHLDPMHLAFNMYWIWKMGTILETTIAPWKYILFVVAGTMVGSCCELLISGQTGAGASGAGYALMGLLWAGRGFHGSWRNMATLENMRLFLIWGVLCIFLTAAHMMAVANGAHFGGFLFGLTIGSLFYAPRRRPIWIVALVFLTVACVVSLTWLPWSDNWNFYKGLQAYARHRYTDSIAYYERSIREGGERAASLNNIALCWYRIGDEEKAHNRMKEAITAYEKGEEMMAASEGEASPSKTLDASSNDKKETAPDSAQPQPNSPLQYPKSKKGP